MRGKLFMSKYSDEHSQCLSHITWLKLTWVWKFVCEQYCKSWYCILKPVYEIWDSKWHENCHISISLCNNREYLGLSLYDTVNIIYLSPETIYHMQVHLVSDRCQVLYQIHVALEIFLKELLPYSICFLAICIIITEARVLCLIYTRHAQGSTTPEGKYVYIWQSMYGCVKTNMLHFWHAQSAQASKQLLSYLV